MRVGSLVPLVAVASIAGFATVTVPRRAGAVASIVVSTAVDEDVDNGVCSLREAIIAANTNADYHGCAAADAGVGDSITFTLGAGTPTINISTTQLPTITEAVTIDGGANKVELHGPGGPPVSGHHGLTVRAERLRHDHPQPGDQQRRRRRHLDQRRRGMGLRLLHRHRQDRDVAMPNQGFGVQIGSGNGNRVGGATSGGSCTGDCNLISGATNFKADVLHRPRRPRHPGARQLHRHRRDRDGGDHSERGMGDHRQRVRRSHRWTAGHDAGRRVHRRLQSDLREHCATGGS